MCINGGHHGARQDVAPEDGDTCGSRAIHVRVRLYNTKLLPCNNIRLQVQRIQHTLVLKVFRISILLKILFSYWLILVKMQSYIW
jgi:hypothetical protein